MSSSCCWNRSPRARRCRGTARSSCCCSRPCGTSRRRSSGPAIAWCSAAADSYAEGLRDVAREIGASRVVATEGREQDMVDELARARDLLAADGVALVLREDRGFMATRADFTTWAEGRQRVPHGVVLSRDAPQAWHPHGARRTTQRRSLELRHRQPEAMAQGPPGAGDVARRAGRHHSRADGPRGPVARPLGQRRFVRAARHPRRCQGVAGALHRGAAAGVRSLRRRARCTVHPTCCTRRSPRCSTWDCCIRARWSRAPSVPGVTGGCPSSRPKASFGRSSAGVSTSAACTGS